jgi:hypothetical protein
MKSLSKIAIITATIMMGHLHARSSFRLEEYAMPTISIINEENETMCTLSHRHLAAYPTFYFTVDMLKPFMMPALLSYPNKPSRFIDRKRINQIIENLIVEIKEGKQSFSDVTLLKKKNFNFRKKCGLIIVKCNHHPFIIKLFMERPETYFDPYCKGVESIAFFFAAGGVNRHSSGLSRVMNLYHTKNKLARMPEWRSLIAFPRKWFWLPQKPRFMTFHGTHVEGHPTLTNKIPEVFAIVADEVDLTTQIKISAKEKEKIIIKLCNHLNLYLDPHLPNFVFQKSTTAPFKITILDTEHFQTMVGLYNPPRFSNYVSWYSYLIAHFFKQTLLRGKNNTNDSPSGDLLFDCSDTLFKCS